MGAKRTLVVGVGSIGERHVRCFQRTGRATLSICEVNEKLCREVAERYRITQRWTSFEVALNQPCDLAVICTPAHLHVPMATRLAQRGVDLLIEKPLSTSLAGIDALESEIARHGCIAAVAYVWRAHPVFQAVKRAIDSGRFGAPLNLIGVSGQHFPTYRPAYRDTYYTQHTTGGGAIQDAMTHLLNMGEALAGPIDQLVADAGHLALAGVEVEDTVHVLTRHGSVMGSYQLNQHQAPNETSVTVVCEQGTVRFEPHRSRWRWMTERGGTWSDESCELERDDMFVNQANALLDALADKRPLLCTFAEGLQTLRVNLAVLRSVASRSWQSLEAD